MPTKSKAKARRAEADQAMKEQDKRDHAKGCALAQGIASRFALSGGLETLDLAAIKRDYSTGERQHLSMSLECIALDLLRISIRISLDAKRGWE